MRRQWQRRLYSTRGGADGGSENRSIFKIPITHSKKKKNVINTPQTEKRRGIAINFSYIEKFSFYTYKIFCLYN